MVEMLYRLRTMPRTNWSVSPSTVSEYVWHPHLLTSVSQLGMSHSKLSICPPRPVASTFPRWLIELHAAGLHRSSAKASVHVSVGVVETQAPPAASHFSLLISLSG